MKSALKILSIFIVVGLVAAIFINFYSYIFSERVEGIVQKVERVDLNVALMAQGQAQEINPSLYSFAIAIKTSNGEIKTASSQDRQWAVIEEGKCVEARYYPYPFWNLDKSGTYFNARVLKYQECPKDP